jgi:hypothetical protein
VTLHHEYGIRLCLPPTKYTRSSLLIRREKHILQARRESQPVMTCTMTRLAPGLVRRRRSPFSMVGRRLVNVTSLCRTQQTCSPCMCIPIFPSKVSCMSTRAPLEIGVASEKLWQLDGVDRGWKRLRTGIPS